MVHCPWPQFLVFRIFHHFNQTNLKLFQSFFQIGDLGLSKIKQRTLVSGGVRGTLPWMAPELLNSKDSMVTEKVSMPTLDYQTC